MKPHLYRIVFALCFRLTVCCEAADPPPIMPNCEMLQALAVTDLKQRLEVTAPGFSVLPPQGERWCYRFLSSAGISFFKMPQSLTAFDGPPSLQAAALHLSGAMAMSLKGLRDFGTIHSPADLKSLVGVLISEHVFSQISAGIVTAEHGFRLLESTVATDSSLGANCVIFDAKVEERGSAHGPGLVLLLNFPGNVVCRHPTASDIDLIWVGFTERYIQGDRPTSDTLRGEYEPFVRSLQFMAPRE